MLRRPPLLSCSHVIAVAWVYLAALARRFREEHYKYGEEIIKQGQVQEQM